MPRKTSTGKRIAIQARLTEDEHAIMTANMYRAGFGLVSEYLTYLATSDVPMRINSIERIVGAIGIRTNDLLSDLLARGVSRADLDVISLRLTEIQTALAREITGR